MKLNEKELTINGYKKYSPGLEKYADCLYQKDIRDSESKLKYFINFYQYTIKDSIVYTVKLYFCRLGTSYTLSFNTDTSTVDMIEDEVEEFWAINNMDYDYHND